MHIPTTCISLHRKANKVGQTFHKSNSRTLRKSEICKGTISTRSTLIYRSVAIWEKRWNAGWTIRTLSTAASRTSTSDRRKDTRNCRTFSRYTMLIRRFGCGIWPSSISAVRKFPGKSKELRCNKRAWENIIANNYHEIVNLVNSTLMNFFIYTFF